MSPWIKASEQMPKVGRLVVVRNPNETYNEAGDLEFCWEYNAGLVKGGAQKKYWYVSVANGEYQEYFEDETEWQYLEE